MESRAGTALTPGELVANESPNRIRDHLDRKARYNPTRSLTALTSQLTQEYEDRFLVELVQNGYDAQPPGTRDGCLHVRLDESGSGGPVLYVANTGTPFTAANFDALTNVAKSSKPPGEGIGNKGVGFRSVLQVCEWPEIYSCDELEPSPSRFNGFCFGFANDAQIRAMVSDDVEYEIVKRDFSRYLLPVVATPSDSQLGVLRRLGMVTVVRLPLTSRRAVELARVQVHRLLEPTPPIALFLDRVRSITVEHVDCDGREVANAVDRLVDDVAGPPGGPTLRWVESVERRFLTTTRTLTGDRVRHVVNEAIAAGELDSSWGGWDADVEVSLAVPALGTEDDREWPSTYTYLPMRVRAPAYAHLHAPFHTKLARLDLNEDSIFNAYLIKTAADLAAATIKLLTSDEPSDLDLPTRQAAAVDLLCWDAGHIAHLQAALKRLDLDFAHSPVVPTRTPQGPRWAGLVDVRTWTPIGTDVLTTEAIAAHAHVLEPSLGAARTERLNAVCKHAMSHGLRPDDSEVADWVEKVAAGLASAPITLCRPHHRAYDRGVLDLVPHLEPDHRDEVAHAVGHLGLVGALRRLSGRRDAAGAA